MVNWLERSTYSPEKNRLNLWISEDYIFSMITPKKRGRLKPFIEFMQEHDSEEVTRLFSLKKLPSFFGPESFITGIKEKYYFKKKSYEVPESKRLSPTFDSIISVVCEHYDVSFNELLYPIQKPW